jgi:hypothetical protein
MYSAKNGSLCVANPKRQAAILSLEIARHARVIPRGCLRLGSHQVHDDAGNAF